MTELNKTEKNLICLLVLLGACKKTVNSVCCLLTEEGRKKLIEQLIAERKNNEKITEDLIHEMALKVAEIPIK